MARPVRKPTFDLKKISISATNEIARNWSMTTPGFVKPAPFIGLFIEGVGRLLLIVLTFI